MKKLLQFFLSAFVFLLPWQTFYITREVFLQGDKWQSGTLGFFATEILLWICIGIFIFMYIQKFRALKEKKFHFSWSSDRIFVASILLFILYCFTSILWSLDKQIALQQSLHIMEAFLLFFILFLADFDKIHLVKCFIAGAAVQSFLGIYQFLTQTTFSFKWLGLVAHPVQELGSSVIAGEGIGRVLRAYGAFSHPNIFGGYLVIAIVFTVFLFLKEKKNKFLQCALLLQYVALFFTFSRAAWMSTVVLLLGYTVYCVKMKQRESLKIVVMSFLVFLFLCIIYFPLLHTRVSQSSNLEIRSTQERIVGYKEALQIWKTSPIVGVAVGNYTVASQLQNPNQSGYMYQPVHNVFLLFFSEFGVLGFLLFLAVLVNFYKFLPQNQSTKYYFFFFFGVFVFLLFFDHYLYSSYLGLLISALYFSGIFHFSLNRGEK
jgi:O-antigen ligase